MLVRIWRKENPLYIIDGNVNWWATMENSMAISQKTKIELAYDLAIPLLSIYLKKMKTLIWKNTYIPMFIVALFTIAKIWKQSKCPLTDEWINKMWNIYIYIYIYIMEYYPAIKKDVILPFAATWMHLEGICQAYALSSCHVQL